MSSHIVAHTGKGTHGESYNFVVVDVRNIYKLPRPIYTGKVHLRFNAINNGYTVLLYVSFNAIYREQPYCHSIAYRHRTGKTAKSMGPNYAYV